MGKLLARVSRAVQAFRSPGLATMAATSVRPMDLGEGYGRRVQYQQLDLMQMYAGIVKVAASRNAAGIASNPIKLYRHKSRDTSFATRSLKSAEIKALRARAGLWACKALDTTDKPELVTDPIHPVNAILRDVNPFNNAYDTMEALVIALGMCGNGYWKIARDPNGMPLELWPLWPQFVHVIPDERKIIGEYVYGRGYETEQRFDPIDVVHFKHVNPRGDPYYGAGDLAACVSEARLGFELVAMAQATIDNGGQPGWLIWGPIGEEQRRQLEISLQSKSAGARNAGRHIVMAVPETFKVERQEYEHQQVISVEQAERFDESVANGFDIPIESIRMKPGGLSGNSQADVQWQTHGLMPRGRKIEDVLNSWIQREAALGNKAFDGVFVAYDEWIKEDENAVHPLVIDAWNAGLTRKSEARTAIGLDNDPADPDADKYIDQTSSAQQERDNAAKQPALPGKPAKSAHVHGDRGAAPLALASRTTGKGAALGIAAAGICLAGLVLGPQAHAGCCTHAGKELAFNQTADENERKMEAKLRAFLLALMLDIEDSVTEEGAVMDIESNALARAGFDAATGPELAASIRAGIRRGAADSAAHAVEVQAESAVLNMEAERRADEMVRDQQDRAWESVSQTLQKKVEAAIREGQSQSETLALVRRRVRDVVEKAADTTPEGVSGFEVANAYMTAKERIWVEAGAQVTKFWKTAKNPCPVCKAVSVVFNGLGLKPGEAMLVKGESMMLSPELGLLTASYADLFGPPLHPLCRCIVEERKL